MSPFGVLRVENAYPQAISLECPHHGIELGTDRGLLVVGQPRPALLQSVARDERHEDVGHATNGDKPEGIRYWYPWRMGSNIFEKRVLCRLESFTDLYDHIVAELYHESCRARPDVIATVD